MSVDQALSPSECFQVKNNRSYPIGIHGINESHDRLELDDPCLKDPNEADYLFEGSCEELWWSRTLWEDILGAYESMWDHW